MTRWRRRPLALSAGRWRPRQQREGLPGHRLAETVADEASEESKDLAAAEASEGRKGSAEMAAAEV